MRVEKPRLPESPILEQILNLTPDWNPGGTLSNAVLSRLHGALKGRGEILTCETGSGRSTLLFASIAKCHLVFTLRDPPFEKMFASRMEELSRNTEFVFGPSQATLPTYAFDRSFDCVLIDGPHAFPYPELEYYYLYPHLKPGGILVIDDIHIPSVHILYKFLREEIMFRPLEVVGTTALFERTWASTFPTSGCGWWDQAYNARHFPLSIA